MQIRTDYLRPVYTPAVYAKLVTQMTSVIKDFKKKHPFDALAFTGQSGSAIAYPLSLRLKKPLICIRKGPTHYTKGKIEGVVSAKTYIIVDDFIEYGKTIDKIKKLLTKELEAKLVGIALYNNTHSNIRTWDGVPVLHARNAK